MGPLQGDDRCGRRKTGRGRAVIGARAVVGRLPNLALAVCVIVAGWLVVVPLIALVVTAFSEDTLYGTGAFTLANIVEAYGSPHVLRVFANSLAFAAGTALLTLCMGGLVAWAVERTDMPGGALFHMLSLLSFALPGLLIAMAWIFVLSPNTGWANLQLKAAFGLDVAPFNIYSLGGMIWALASHYFPLAYLTLGPALRALDRRLEEAALVAGGRYGQIIRRVTLPLLRPPILSALLLLFVMSMASFEVPRLIGRPARIDVFTTDIQVATGGTPPAFGIAAALSLMLLAICVLAVYCYRLATRNAEAFATVTGKGYTPTRIKLGPWRWPLAIGIGLMFVLCLGLPLFALAWQSFFRNLVPPFVASQAHFTLENYQFVLSYPVFLNAVKTSILLAAMAATVVIGLSIAMALVVQRSRMRQAWILDALAFAPIAVPSVIVGASILFTYLMLPIGIYNTIWILLVAYVTLYLPYGMRFAASGLTQIHRELEEAALVSGAQLRHVFTRILLPLLTPVLLAAWIYVFVLAVRELSASIFLIGPGTHVLGTISLTMWEEGGSYGAVCALGVLQAVPLLLIVGALRWFEVRIQRHGNARTRLP